MDRKAFDEAVRLEKEKRYDQALEGFRALAREDPGSASLWYHQGNCLLQAGRVAEALEPLAEALRLWPGMGWAGFRRAQCLHRLGRHGACRVALRELWDAFRDDAGQAALVRQVLVLWADSFEAEGNLDLALRAAGKAREMDPGNVFRHYHEGKLLAALGRHDEAAGAFRQANRLDGGLDYVVDRLAQSLHRAGRGDEALQAYRNFPCGKRNWYYHLHFAGFLLERGMLPEAEMEAGASVVRQGRQNPHGWFLLGRVLRQLGRAGEALHCFREAAADMGRSYGKEYPEAAEAAESVLREGAEPLPPSLYREAAVETWREDRGFGFLAFAAGRAFFHVSACRGFRPAEGVAVRAAFSLGSKGCDAMRVLPAREAASVLPVGMARAGTGLSGSPAVH